MKKPEKRDACDKGYIPTWAPRLSQSGCTDLVRGSPLVQEQVNALTRCRCKRTPRGLCWRRRCPRTRRSQLQIDGRQHQAWSGPRGLPQAENGSLKPTTSWLTVIPIDPQMTRGRRRILVANLMPGMADPMWTTLVAITMMKGLEIPLLAKKVVP